MNADQPVGMLWPNLGGDELHPNRRHGAEPAIASSRHQPFPEVRGHQRIHARRFSGEGKAEAGQIRRDESNASAGSPRRPLDRSNGPMTFCQLQTSKASHA